MQNKAIKASLRIFGARVLGLSLWQCCYLSKSDALSTEISTVSIFSTNVSFQFFLFLLAESGSLLAVLVKPFERPV